MKGINMKTMKELLEQSILEGKKFATGSTILKNVNKEIKTSSDEKYIKVLKSIKKELVGNKKLGLDPFNNEEVEWKDFDYFILAKDKEFKKSGLSNKTFKDLMKF